MLEEFLSFILTTVLVLLWGWTFLKIVNEVVKALYRRYGPRIYGPTYDERTPWYIYPVAQFTYPCHFCGGAITVSRPLGRYTPPLHSSCVLFTQTLQSLIDGVPGEERLHGFIFFTGGDKAVLRRSVLQIDPDVEVIMMNKKLSHMAVSYKVKVRSRSLIKSAKKE